MAKIDIKELLSDLNVTQVKTLKRAALPEGLKFIYQHLPEGFHNLPEKDQNQYLLARWQEQLDNIMMLLNSGYQAYRTWDTGRGREKWVDPKGEECNPLPKYDELRLSQDVRDRAINSQSSALSALQNTSG